MSADATQVTGSPLAGPGPRPGAVLAERYELLEIIDSDGPAISFRALDQESERQVLVRILAGPGVHTDICDAMVARLRDLVGVGGRFLASLLDADRQGRSPFTVEAWPKGTPLSAILDSRRGRGEALGAREALPVIAQLAAALAALPDGLHHGDVRAERVWLDTDGLRLTGGFLLAGLPEDELEERIQGLGPGAVAYAPEVKAGMTGPASDLWGVGSIAWEALTGRSPDPSAPSPEVEGELKEALVALLAEAPDERPPDLKTILEAVAQEADLPVPSLDPEPHQPPTAVILSPIAAEGTEPAAAEAMAMQEEPASDSLDPRLVRAALGVSMADDSDEGHPGDDHSSNGHSMDTAKHASVSEDLADSLDPRLVRAALDVQLESSSTDLVVGEPSSDGLDPRLVRAALGVELDSTESIEMELVEEIEAPPKKPFLGKPRPLPRPKPFAGKPNAKSGFPRPGAKLVGKKPAVPRPIPRPRSAPSAPKPRAQADAPPGPKPRPRADSASGPVPRPRVDAPPGPKPRPRADSAGLPAPKPRPRADSAGLPAPKPRPRADAPPGPKPRPRTDSDRPAAPKPRPRADAPPVPTPRPRAETPAASAPRPRSDSGSLPPPPDSADQAAPGPQASAPAPRPRTASDRPPPRPHAVQPDRPAGSPLPVAAPEPVVYPSAATPQGASMAEFDIPMEDGTIVVAPRVRRPAPAKRRNRTGMVIVAIALLIAVAIVGVGFLIAAQRRADAAHGRQLDERFEELRQEGVVP